VKQKLDKGARENLSGSWEFRLAKGSLKKIQNGAGEEGGSSGN